MSARRTGAVVEVRLGAYHDSVTLMQVSRRLREVPGVRAAQVAMGTPLNLELLDGMGLTAPPGTGPDDLVLAMDVEDDAARERALAALADALAPSAGSGGGGGAGEQPPLTTGSALRRHPAGLVVVSVPGEAAFAEALDAVQAGASVMVFSDNVPVEQEISLKCLAAQRDVLVMGPDCGTAVVGGLGLGFANVVRPGPVSLVAASGTGAQQVMSLLDAAGVGVRHCLGLGGRDLSAAVGGRSASQALRALAADAGT
jgi:FdrA protein